MHNKILLLNKKSSLWKWVRQKAIHSLCCRCALSFQKSAHCYSSCPVSLQLTFQIKKITYLQFCIFYPLQNTKVSQGCNFCLCLCACPDVHVGSLGCPTKPCRVTLFCQSRVSICAWQPAMQQANNKNWSLLRLLTAAHSHEGQLKTNKQVAVAN